MVESSVFPRNYEPVLNARQTESAIKFIKETFERELSGELKLSRVTAPMFVEQGTGINDDLSGIERAVKFSVSKLSGRNMEIVHSLAKWKRMVLADEKFDHGTGLYTDMNAIRADDDVDNIHSIYVDQWDWERVIDKSEYNLDFLKKIVVKIYSALKRTEFLVCQHWTSLNYRLARDIVFVHSEDALKEYPDLTPEQRERKLAEKYGAVFVVGIGGKLADGKPHGLRAPDYDNWTEDTGNGHFGLNGDIIVWDDIRKDSLELSSMGIRVDDKSLLLQLKLTGKEERKNLYWHKRLLSGDFPLTVGGGIGQSRVCMFLLHKAHIGEVQSSVWDDATLKEAAEHGVKIL
ncbi:MAG TPA: aspartate--ammonia ligase [Spirochaetaceae bacterium]|nr:aspartate--ammonia ligase [Spirochaetaceae bacterium]